MKRDNPIRRKLSGRGGFTLTELLATTIIMLLSTGVIVQTLQLGIRQFNARTRESEQQILCNTLSLAIQDQLTYVNVWYTDGKFISGAMGMSDAVCEFVTGRADAATKAYVEDASGTQLLLKYQQGASNGVYPLVNYADYADDTAADGNIKLIASLDQCEYDATAGYFKVRVSVKNTGAGGSSTQDAVNEFTVTPLKKQLTVITA